MAAQFQTQVLGWFHAHVAPMVVASFVMFVIFVFTIAAGPVTNRDDHAGAEAH